MGDLPATVAKAVLRASKYDFGYSCDEVTGRLLAVLAAAVPVGGSVLELGTGVGVGTSWLVHGLSGRDDAGVLTVEHDTRTAAIAAEGDWPGWVEIMTGEAEGVLPQIGAFDLVFADAEGGKWSGLELTLASLRDGGILVLDDMDPGRYELPEHRAAIEDVRRALAADRCFTVVDLPVGSGIVLASRRRVERAAVAAPTARAALVDR